MTTKNEAKALVNKLRSGLLSLSTVLPKIVEVRAWEPLGYDTFADMWAAELGDLDLSGAPRAAAVYALLESGATDEEVTACVKGVGPARAAVYRTAFVRDVDPAAADRTAMRSPEHSRPGESYVQGHYRKPGRPQFRITLEGFSADEIARWKKAAALRDLDYRVWLAGLLRDATAGVIDGE